MRPRLTIASVAYPLAPVGSDAVGGSEQVLAALDRALVARGHRSIVVARAGSTVAGELVEIPAETGRLDDEAKARAWRNQQAAISDVLERNAIDLVHLHGVDFHSYLPARAPSLVTFHLPLDWYPPAAWVRRPGLWRNCVSVSQARTAPVDAALLPPITNGVPVDALGGPFAKREFVLTLGRICPEKGIHLALDAARMADLPLLIGGQVFEYDAHRRYFAEAVAPKLDARRRFLGPLRFRAKRRLLASARCLAVPSLAAETSSLVAMEALASGTPVIAFPHGALPEIVEDGRTGFLVSTVKEMAQAMRWSDRVDPALCRRAAVERFSVERMVSEYLALYGQLVRARRTLPAEPEPVA